MSCNAANYLVRSILISAPNSIVRSWSMAAHFVSVRTSFCTRPSKTVRPLAIDLHRLREVELIRRQQQRERGDAVRRGLDDVAGARQVDAARASGPREQRPRRAGDERRFVGAADFHRQIVARHQQIDVRAGLDVLERVLNVGAGADGLVVQPHEHVAVLQANLVGVRAWHHAVDARAVRAHAEIRRRPHRHLVQIGQRLRFVLHRSDPIDHEPVRPIVLGDVATFPTSACPAAAAADARGRRLRTSP